MSVKQTRIIRQVVALMALLITQFTFAQIDTGDAVDEAVNQMEQIVPLLEAICGFGIVGVLIYGGWKWQSDNVDKTKLIGQIVAVVVVLGIAYWAMDSLF